MSHEATRLTSHWYHECVANVWSEVVPLQTRSHADIPMCLAVLQNILLFSEKLLLPAMFITHSDQMSHGVTRLTFHWEYKWSSNA